VKQIKKIVKHSTRVLEIIHTYIYSPFLVRTIDGFDSLITFIDNYSHYSYIYPIKEMSEALDNFKQFKVEGKSTWPKNEDSKIRSWGSIMADIQSMGKYKGVFRGFYEKMGLLLSTQH
jgi:hypothetical protein